MQSEDQNLRLLDALTISQTISDTELKRKIASDFWKSLVRAQNEPNLKYKFVSDNQMTNENFNI